MAPKLKAAAFDYDDDDLSDDDVKGRVASAGAGNIKYVAPPLPLPFDDLVRSSHGNLWHGVVARAVMDVSSTKEGRLSFTKGRLLTNVFEGQLDGYLNGKLDGVPGLFPKRAVELFVQVQCQPYMQAKLNYKDARTSFYEYAAPAEESSEDDEGDSAMAAAASSQSVVVVKPSAPRTHTNPSAQTWFDKDPPIQGFLYKQGAKFKTWKKRYMVASEDGWLYYYNSIDDPEPLGVVDLRNCAVSDAEFKKKEFCFQIHHPTRRTYFMYAESLTIKNKWMQTIREVARDPENRPNIKIESLASSSVGGGGGGSANTVSSSSEVGSTTTSTATSGTASSPHPRTGSASGSTNGVPSPRAAPAPVYSTKPRSWSTRTPSNGSSPAGNPISFMGSDDDDDNDEEDDDEDDDDVEPGVTRVGIELADSGGDEDGLGGGGSAGASAGSSEAPPPQVAKRPPATKPPVLTAKPSSSFSMSSTTPPSTPVPSSPSPASSNSSPSPSSSIAGAGSGGGSGARAVSPSARATSPPPPRPTSPPGRPTSPPTSEEKNKSLGRKAVNPFRDPALTEGTSAVNGAPAPPVPSRPSVVRLGANPTAGVGSPGARPVVPSRPGRSESVAGGSPPTQGLASSGSAPTHTSVAGTATSTATATPSSAPTATTPPPSTSSTSSGGSGAATDPSSASESPSESASSQPSLPPRRKVVTGERRASSTPDVPIRPPARRTAAPPPLESNLVIQIPSSVADVCTYTVEYKAETDTVGDVLDRLRVALGLTSASAFTLWIVGLQEEAQSGMTAGGRRRVISCNYTEGGLEVELERTMLMSDGIRKFQRIVTESQLTLFNTRYDICCRASSSVTPEALQEALDEPLSTKLLYHECLSHFCDGHYRLTWEEVIPMSALVLQSQEEAPDVLNEMIVYDALPRHLRVPKEIDVIRETYDAWRDLKGEATGVAAMGAFVHQLSSTPSFSSTFFAGLLSTTGRSPDVSNQHVYMGVNARGLHIVFVDGKYAVIEIEGKDIVSSAQVGFDIRFVLTDSQTLTFVSRQALLMRDYVTRILNI